MGLSDGRKSFRIRLAVLIQYRSVTATQPPSQPRCCSYYAQRSGVEPKNERCNKGENTEPMWLHLTNNIKFVFFPRCVSELLSHSPKLLNFIHLFKFYSNFTNKHVSWLHFSWVTEYFTSCYFSYLTLITLVAVYFRFRLYCLPNGDIR